jgi:hypothetical protein
VRIADKDVEATLRQEGTEVRLVLPRRTRLRGRSHYAVAKPRIDTGQAVRVTLTW